MLRKKFNTRYTRHASESIARLVKAGQHLPEVAVGVGVGSWAAGSCVGLAAVLGTVVIVVGVDRI